MSEFYLDYLKHIRDECVYILKVVPAGKPESEFMADQTLKRAVVRSLEIIGEASKKIPSEIKALWPEIEWKNMAGMRDRLIHDYMGTNYVIVYDVAKNKIPHLYSQLMQIIDIEEGK